MDIDDAEFVTLSGWKFAQAKISRFFASHKADVDRAVFEDNFVCQALCGFDLFLRQCGRIEIDGAIIVCHVERDGRHVVEAG